MSDRIKCHSCGAESFNGNGTVLFCNTCHKKLLSLVTELESRLAELELRWTSGGNGSHWDGCAEVHWDCKIAQLEARCNNLEQENAKLKEANEDVQSRLDDYRQDYAKVVNDKCPSDEIHCGCVPILRRENRLLAEELENAKDELKNRRDALIDAQEIYNTANQHRFRYLSALELIASFANAKDKTSVDDLIAIAGKEINCESDSIVDACNYWVQKLRDVEDENRKLKERVKELEAESRWIPVTERLPVDSQFILIANGKHSGEGAYDPKSTQWYWDNGIEAHNVTHWRPMPPVKDDRQ